MFGIEDPMIWLAYASCIVSTLICVVYGMINWNRGDEEIETDDIQWIDQEKKLEEEESE